MITKLYSLEELVSILSETFFNKTDKVTKISDDSVLNGELFGMAKIGQKVLVEIANLESQVLPDGAVGTKLDTVAEKLGISPRFQDLSSTTYVLLMGDVGTLYDKNIVTLQSRSGITFKLTDNILIGDSGYAYGLVQSVETGIRSNVDSLTINQISPIPVGHTYLINEYQAEGGRDIETDQQLLIRIKNGPNLIAKETLERLTQILINKGYGNVLRIVYQGCDNLGRNVVAVLSQNGVAYTQLELDGMAQILTPYLGFTDSITYENKTTKLKMINAAILPIDISFRCELEPGVDFDEVRKKIQIKCTKTLNLLTWDDTRIVEWEDFLIAAKTTKGIKYIPDQYFYPKVDLKLPRNTFPRIRGFRLLDKDGNIISNFDGSLSPLFFPKEADYNFQKALLVQY